MVAGQCGLNSASIGIIFLLFPYPFTMYSPESRTELEMGPGWPASTALRTAGTLARPLGFCGGNGWPLGHRLGGFSTHLRLAEVPNCWSGRLAGKSGPQSKSQAGMAAGYGSMLFTNNFLGDLKKYSGDLFRWKILLKGELPDCPHPPSIVPFLAEWQRQKRPFSFEGNALIWLGGTQ